MSERNEQRGNSESIENQILAAGDFVEVDRMLRPAVIETAVAEVACRKAWQRGAVLAAAVLCLTVVAGSVGTKIHRETARKTQSRQATLESHLDTTDWSWGFVQMFQHVQKERTRAFEKDD